MIRFLITFLLSLSFSLCYAQPANDECVNAISLGAVEDYCSMGNEFTNNNATNSTDPGPTCFPGGMDHDVWFSFVPTAPAALVQVVGQQTNGDGNIQNPGMAVYSGSCGSLTQLDCGIYTGTGTEIVELTVMDLVIGQTYYIRIDANNSEGNFMLCVDSFVPTPTPESDCPDAVVLCDKTAFVIPNLNSTGNIQNEMTGSCATGLNGENASAWYVWTAETTGTLEFTLSPNNPNSMEEDIDFVVYEFPGGINDCANRVALRCMFSGSNGDPVTSAPCFGDTGLVDGDPDISEGAGCTDDDNNYADAIDMVAGNSYGMIINNYSESGFGFSVEFGGTGTFQGPDLDISFSGAQLTCGSTVTFDDVVTNFPSANIASYNWDFGVDSSPANSVLPGPIDVVYATPGTKFVSLTVMTIDGCTVNHILELEIVAGCMVDPSITFCPASSNVTCAANVNPGNVGDVTFNTDCDIPGVVTRTGPVINGAPNCDGTTYTYTFTVTDDCGLTDQCQQVFTITNAGTTFSCLPDATVECASAISAAISDVTVNTQCGISSMVAISLPNIQGDAGCDGTTYTYTYMITDGCGLNTTCQRTFTISNAAPTISCPANVTTNCFEDVMAGTPTFTTSCGLMSAIEIMPPTLTSGVAKCSGSTYSIVYLVRDECGRQATCTQTFTLDINAPTINCPADETVACFLDISIGTIVPGIGCGLTTQVSTSGPTLISGDDNCDGAIYEIEYTVTDECMATALCTQTFTINMADPVINCPADLTVDCLSDVVAGVPAASASCGQEVTVASTAPTLFSGSEACNDAVYQIVYTASDDCGNSSTCIQNFTLTVPKPTITCPANMTVECFSDIVAGIPMTNVSCSQTPSVSNTAPSLVSGNANCDGAVYEIEYTVTDNCSQSANCTQTFTLDLDGPSITCPADMTVECFSDISAGTAMVTTTCSLSSSVMASTPAIISGSAGCDNTVYEIIYTVTDGCGATASCTQSFTLNVPLPTISCPADMTVSCFF